MLMLVGLMLPLAPTFVLTAQREGGLVIADEVQSGYARTGLWWEYESTGFRPDIIVTGKPMGNGLPLAATEESRKWVDRDLVESCYRPAALKALKSFPVEAENVDLIAHSEKVTFRVSVRGSDTV